MTQPYPLPRDLRQSAVDVGDGGASYGPFGFKIFDIEDVEAWTLTAEQGAVWTKVDGLTVAKTSDDPFDTFSVTFPAALANTTQYVVYGRRLQERSTAVTRGGSITSNELEKELSKLSVVADELRRDVDRAHKAKPGGDGALVDADDIGAAEGYAAIATTQAGIATTEAGIATEKAAEAAATVASLGKPLSLKVPDPSWDASQGTFPGAAGVKAGTIFLVTVAGTVDGVDFSAAPADMLIALVDDPSTGTYDGNWLKQDFSDLVLSVAGLKGAVSGPALVGAIGLDEDDMASDSAEKFPTQRSTKAAIPTIEFPLAAGLRERSVRDRFAEVVNLLDYADPADGDSSPDINAAVAEINSRGGGAIIVPTMFNCASDITIPSTLNGPIAFLGYSRAISGFSFTAAPSVAGICGGQTTVLAKPVDIRGLKFHTEIAGGGSAVNLKFGSYASTLTFKDNEISGDYYDNYWTYGLWAENIRDFYITDNLIWGAANSENSALRAIYIAADRTSTMGRIERNLLRAHQTHIDIEANASPSIEGIYILGNHMTGGSNGINANAASSGYVPPEWRIDDNHMNVTSAAVIASSLAQGSISKNLIYCASPQQIVLDDCVDFIVRNNIMRSATGYAVLLRNNTQRVRVCENIVQDALAVARIITGAQNNYIGPNVLVGSTAPWSFGSTPGTGNILYADVARDSGTVTQATSKSTGVTLNASSGKVTMSNAALAAGTIVSFTLTNSAIAAGDVLILNHVSGGTPGAYTLNAQCGAGSATINVRNNTSGSLSEAIVIGYTVIKGATS